MAPLAAALAFSACATAPPSTSTAPTPSTPSASEASRQAQLLRAAGGANAPTQTEIERAFGTADIVRQDGAGAALTYRLENCALLLLFAADSRNTLRLAEAHPSARRANAPAPSIEDCVAEAAARRS